LLLLAGGVYFLSYLYILFDVYQTIRFESWFELHNETRETKRRVGLPWLKAGRKANSPRQTGAKSTLAYAANVALRVFSIGIVQSFLVTLFVSGLLLPVVFAGEMPPAASPWENSSLGWIAFNQGTDTEVIFVFVPALVLLWTGMALFIGAFVQLLWQERRMTSPVRE
jgi:hypothetical protein